MPTKTLPSPPSLDHLKYQAKDLIKARQAGDPAACQRVREFHPRFYQSTDDEIKAAAFSLSDAQLTIAREYGFASWARVRAQAESPKPVDLDSPLRDRIEDPVFRSALDQLDAGDFAGLKASLKAYPDLVHRRVSFEGQNYFRNPSLLEFCAENPIRNGSLPANIVEIAQMILEAGARSDKRAVDETLGLVCSGRVPRECGVQIPLIDLLCRYGADPSAAMGAPLGHGEFAAAERLLAHGAKLDLPAAAALGLTDAARRLLEGSTALDRRKALAYAAQFGHEPIVRLLLDAGENPNGFNPPGTHSHSTPLHQAAFAGHLAVVQLLVERGADREVKDILWHGTPLGWAEHGGQTAVAEYLVSAP